MPWYERHGGESWQSLPTRRGRQAATRVLVTTLIGLAAAWMTWKGILPGRSVPILGPTIQGVLWACLSVCLGIAYRAVAREKTESDRTVVPKVGAGLVLALMSAYVCERVVRPWLVPVSWAISGLS